MQSVIIIIYITIFGYIPIIKDLIGYNTSINYKSFVNYIYFVIQKVDIEIIIDFIAKKFIVYVNITKIIYI